MKVVLLFYLLYLPFLTLAQKADSIKSSTNVEINHLLFQSLHIGREFYFHSSYSFEVSTGFMRHVPYIKPNNTVSNIISGVFLELALINNYELEVMKHKRKFFQLAICGSLARHSAQLSVPTPYGSYFTPYRENFYNFGIKTAIGTRFKLDKNFDLCVGPQGGIYLGWGYPADYYVPGGGFIFNKIVIRNDNFFPLSFGILVELKYNR